MLAKLKLSSLLSPQEGILQRLQNSVEQEESRWRVKLELSQGELKEVCVQVEQEKQLPDLKWLYHVAVCTINCIILLCFALDEPESHISGARD